MARVPGWPRPAQGEGSPQGGGRGKGGATRCGADRNTWGQGGGAAFRSGRMVRAVSPADQGRGVLRQRPLHLEGRPSGGGGQGRAGRDVLRPRPPTGRVRERRRCSRWPGRRVMTGRRDVPVLGSRPGARPTGQGHGPAAARSAEGEPRQGPATELRDGAAGLRGSRLADPEGRRRGTPRLRPPAEGGGRLPENPKRNRLGFLPMGGLQAFSGRHKPVPSPRSMPRARWTEGGDGGCIPGGGRNAGRWDGG